MSNKIQFFVKFILIYTFFLFITNYSNAQGYIAASTYIGGYNNDDLSKLVVVNGESYILGVTNSANFPTTLGSPIVNSLASDNDMTLTKLDASGTKIWSRKIGGSNDDFLGNIVVSNGSVYITGRTRSADYPVTDGSTATGDVGVYSKFDATTGIMQFSTLLWSNEGFAPQIVVSGGYAYIMSSAIIAPATSTDLIITKFDLNTNNRIFTKSFGGSNEEDLSTFKVVGNDIFICGISYSSTDFPVTNGSSPGDFVYIKANASTGAINFATYFGTRSSQYGQYITDMVVDNNKVYISGITDVDDFPVTDGSIHNTNHSIEEYDIFLIKFDGTTNNKEYAKYIGGDLSEAGGQIAVQNGILYMTGSTLATNFPVTVGSGSVLGSQNIFYAKFNAATGNTIYSTLIRSTGNQSAASLKIINGEAYILGTDQTSSNYPTTDGSVHTISNPNIILTKISTDNKICYSTIIGGTNTTGTYLGDSPYNDLYVIGDNIYFVGSASSNDYPVTNNILYGGGQIDILWTRLNLNPIVTPNPDILSPATQTVCKNALTSTVGAPAVTLPTNSFPTIYRNGVASIQNPLIFNYQWQKSDAATGPWTNISGAIQQDYTPNIGLINQYYRRIANATVCATATPISTSTVAEVLVNSFSAPIVNAGNVINTCTNTATTLGGAPTATGTSPFTYLWSPSGSYNPNNTSPNPIVSPLVNTIYTVTVTDANGCKQVGQNLVNVYSANAGPDVSTCANKIVRIGSTQIAGLTGVTYSWTASPADATMSCTTCAQPDVHPTVTTTYTLTLTIPITGGGTCSTTDAVIVTPITGPTTSFGAPDLTLCNGSTSGTIGNAAQAGFTYTWTPGNYLSDNHVTPTTFQPGSISNPDPYTYYLTAQKGGCTFVDTIKTFQIVANAGNDGCGPRTVGVPNPTPSIPAVYSWTKVSGTGSIIGRTDSSLINVSASPSGVTIYRVSVTYNGVTCTDDVNVGSCGCSPPTITVTAPNTCASYSVNGGDVTLTAKTNIPGTTIAWSVFTGPAGGLNTYTGTVVKLTDNLARTYRVTATSPDGTTCYTDIPVNSPLMTMPAFTPQNVTTCPATPVNIGQPSVSGYSYLWGEPVANLNSNIISNPLATVNSTTKFPVLITDIGTGCTKKIQLLLQ